MKIAWAPAVAASVGLAACGGGGGGGGVTAVPSAPAPVAPAAPDPAVPAPVTPAPVAPTPVAPAPGANTSLINPTVTQTYAAASSSASVPVNPRAPWYSTGAAAVSASSVGAMTVSYDVATKTYTLSTAGQTSVFRPSDQRHYETPAVDQYQTPSVGGTIDGVFLYNTVPGNPLGLTYSSYGTWQQLTENDGKGHLAERWFVYGVTTAPSDMPRTGGATYQAEIKGSWWRGETKLALQGEATLSANFAAGTTNLSANLSGLSLPNFGSAPLGVVSGAGRIDRASASFSGPMSGAGFTGSYAGRFFGPGAAEMGAAFTLTGPDGAVQGIAIGHH